MAESTSGQPLEKSSDSFFRVFGMGEAIREDENEAATIQLQHRGKNPPAHNVADRVARACDQRRLRKVKCDGERPCKHCVRLFYGVVLSSLD
jgi:hypothetical protein